MPIIKSDSTGNSKNNTFNEIFISNNNDDSSIEGMKDLKRLQILKKQN